MYKTQKSCIIRSKGNKFSCNFAKNIENNGNN